MPNRCIVIDPSVLLFDPHALEKIPGPVRLIIPRSCIEDLGRKSETADMGHFARAALTWLDDLRTANGTLHEETVLKSGATLHIEPNHIGNAVGTTDRVIAVAKWLQTEDKDNDVTILSKDLVCRLRAGSEGVKAEDYQPVGRTLADQFWSGRDKVQVSAEDIAAFYAGNSLPAPEEFYENTCLLVESGTSSGLGRVKNGAIQKIPNAKTPIRLLSAEQKFAWDILSDSDVGIVSLGGTAGAGKTALSLAAAYQAIRNNEIKQNRIVVLRSTYAVGGRGIGFLPGDADEKMGPWGAAIKDAMSSFLNDAQYKELIDKGTLEISPMDYIRGRSFHNCFVIIDEAQNLERSVLLTALSRTGKDTKVVLTHDITQLDNLHVGPWDGVAAMIEVLKGHKEFAHLSMERSERSKTAQLVTSLLGEFSS